MASSRPSIVENDLGAVKMSIIEFEVAEQSGRHADGPEVAEAAGTLKRLDDKRSGSVRSRSSVLFRPDGPAGGMSGAGRPDPEHG